MKLSRFLTSEYILISIILALIIPFSYLFASGGNYTFSLPIVVLSSLYLFSHRMGLKKTGLRSIMVIFLIMTIVTSYSFFLYKLNYTNYPSFLCNAIIPFVLFLVMYTYSSRNKSELLLIIFFCAYYAIGIYYINYQQTIRESMLQQINNFYFVIAPLPFLFLIEKPLLRSLFLVVSTICVVISLKRSGFVIIVLLLLYTAYFYMFTRGKKKHRFLFFVLFVAIAGVGYRYMESLDVEYYDRLLTRMESVQEDGGSGRTDIFKESQKMIGDMNILELAIGKGYSASDSEEKKPTGFHSFHNDYSEAMYSYGIIGFVLLLSFILNIFKKCKYASKTDSRFRFSLISSFIILMVFTFTSSVFHYTYYMLPLFMFWGYVDAQLKPKNELIKKNRK